MSAEQTTIHVQNAFRDALERQGLLELIEARQDAGPAALFALGDAVVERPILLAVSDNGPQMTSGTTREFMAMCAIAQHFDRPGTPTDQAWIESLFGHVKAEWPHLEESATPRSCVTSSPACATSTTGRGCTPASATSPRRREGRGERIRAAGRRGMWLARQGRITYHRSRRVQSQLPDLDGAG